MLKAFFSSNTRIKLLKTFLLDLKGEFFIRELTRMLNEQINSVRRELNNLKKVGLLKCRSRNRKKYYYINHDFPILPELISIVHKCTDIKQAVVKNLQKLGVIDFVLFSGQFLEKQKGAQSLDLFVVGDVEGEEVEQVVSLDFKNLKNLKIAVMKKDDFLYRLKLNDKFIIDMLKDPDNIVAVNKLRVSV
jgi:predicted transcriptional regulator